MARPRVLVTGSSGFIGSHLVKALTDFDVVTWDKREGQPLDDLVGCSHQEGIDFVVHLAGSCSTSRSIDDPVSDFKDNALGTLQALEYARRHKARFIYISSVKARKSVIMTPYGVSKYVGELYCNEYNYLYNLDYIIVRPGTVYGPGQEGSPESGWVSWFLKAKKENKKVTIFGTGYQVRDMLYVDDLVELILTQLKDFNTYKNKTWDVGGGVENSIRVADLARYLELDFDFGPERPGDSMIYVGHNKVPNWKPKTAWKDKL